MFIPYAVDAPLDRLPVVNWLILGGITLVFILQLATSEKPQKPVKKSIEEEIITAPIAEQESAGKHADKKQAVTGPMAWFVLDGWGIGLFTYIWLHGGIAKGVVRLTINLIFLLPFGNAICSKIGNKLYLLVYFGFGLLAGLIHLILSSKTAMGADGALSGIVGMYIVLFPENSISCFFLLPRPMSASVSGYWFVLLWFIFDMLVTGMSSQSTIYCAHILCLGGGFGLAVLMLKKKWLVMDKDEKTLLQMLSKEEKEDLSFVASAKKEEQEQKKEGEKEQIKEPDSADKHPETSAPEGRDLAEGGVEKEKAGPKKIIAGAGKAEDDFIRFRCECGHRIKVHKKNAGKTGRCPKCSRWVVAPRK